MSIPQPITPVRATPQPVTFLRFCSTDIIEVTYIRGFSGQVPEAFELADLADTEFARFTCTLESIFVPSSGKILFKLSSSMRNDYRFLSCVVEL